MADWDVLLLVELCVSVFEMCDGRTQLLDLIQFESMV